MEWKENRDKEVPVSDYYDDTAHIRIYDVVCKDKTEEEIQDILLRVGQMARNE